MPDRIGVVGKPARMQGEFVEQGQQAVDQRPVAVLAQPARIVMQQIEQQDLARGGTQLALIVAGETRGPGIQRAGDGREQGGETFLLRLRAQQPAEARHRAGVRQQDGLTA
jgi:hypothetical protein